MITIREAKLSDAQTLSVFAENCFRDAFSAQNSAEDMDIHCSKSFNKDIQEDEISSTDIITLVAETGGQLVAYAQIFFAKAPDCVSSDKSGEIRRFYVERKWHGKGIAQRLMSECFQLLEENKVEIAWLGVWEENLKAIAFYNKFEFQKVGEQTFLLGNDQQRDALMSHRLREARQ